MLIENTKREAASVQYIDIETATEQLSFIDGVKCRHFMTVGMGNVFVKLNSRMYNTEKTHDPEDIEKLLQIMEDISELLNGRARKDIKNKKELSRLDELEKEEKRLRKAMTDVDRKDIPSLIIVHTMDMEFAHFGGYDGELIYQEDKETGQVFYKEHGQGLVCLDEDDALMFQNWEWQISDVEAVVAKNQSRILPMFSYDPRRYGLSNREALGNKCCEAWNKPFARIVGHKDSDANVKKIWLGFCMNPALGFRPFDEFCEHLPRFYRECEKEGIPILAHCAPEGLTTHDAEYYPGNLDERIAKSKERHETILKEKLSSYQGDALCASMYYGREQVIDGKYDGLGSFYMHYGHPRNWIPVLEHCPDLCLCLTGFGGNREWQRANWPNNGATLPTSHWLRCIIKLTAIYKNVYADLSGLNIYDKKIRNGLLRMLELAQDEESDEFKHLKHKLIFSSGGYLTYLTEASRGGKGIDGGDAVRHSYSNYCNEFKKLFYVADKEGMGKLWEYVSAINPWKFYALSEEKFNKMHEELSKSAEGQNSGTYELSQELRDYCAYMSGGNNDGTSWEPWEPICDDPDLGPYEPKEKLFHIDDSPFDELRSMIEAFANSHKGIVDVKPQSVLVSDTLRDSLIQNLIDMIEGTISKTDKKVKEKEQNESLSARSKQGDLRTEEEKVLNADWLKEVQEILKNGTMDLVIGLGYDRTKGLTEHVEQENNGVHAICFNTYAVNKWMKFLSGCVTKNDMLRSYCIHEFWYFWQIAISGMDLDQYVDSNPLMYNEPSGDGHEQEENVIMLAMNTGEEDGTMPDVQIDGAPQQGSVLQQKVVSDVPKNFGKPYENKKEEYVYLWVMRTLLPIAIQYKFRSREVTSLWKKYLNGGNAALTDLSNSNVIVDAFKNDNVTIKAMGRIYEETQKYFEKYPGRFPKHGEPNEFKLANIINYLLTNFATFGHKDRLNFNVINTIPGNIAGDFGPPGDQSDPKHWYGYTPSKYDDTRRVDGYVTAHKYKIKGVTRTVYRFYVDFKVIDTIDFVPGGAGDEKEHKITGPLSRLEAANLIGDVPFVVNYRVKARGIVGEGLQITE
ncbi:MAG: hypothetical protein LBH93_05995 [Chitinispirillales bacterium]|nr:hypothetical protein [Chitinispirillales bacterium]